MVEPTPPPNVVKKTKTEPEEKKGNFDEDEDSEASLDFDDKEEGVAAMDEEAKEMAIITGSKKFQSYANPLASKSVIIRKKDKETADLEFVRGESTVATAFNKVQEQDKDGSMKRYCENLGIQKLNFSAQKNLAGNKTIEEPFCQIIKLEVRSPQHPEGGFDV